MITAEHKLSLIVGRCKGPVFVSFNDHRTNFRTVAEELASPSYLDQYEDVPADVKAAMIDRNSMIQVQAYADTNVGFYVAYHWSLHLALDEILAALEPEPDPSRTKLGDLIGKSNPYWTADGKPISDNGPCGGSDNV